MLREVQPQIQLICLDSNYTSDKENSTSFNSAGNELVQFESQVELSHFVQTTRIRTTFSTTARVVSNVFKTSLLVFTFR